MIKKFRIVFLLPIVFLSISTAHAASGDNALFSFVPLNGKDGENEVKLVVNTDSAVINHLIFDIINPVDNLVFDMTGSSDPVSFPLSGQSVLGTQTPFTTSSGDVGYDIASSNPTNTGAYSALHFATLIADRNLPTGQGGILSFDTDTAIYVNAQRRGLLGSSYTVLPNAAPQIILPAVNNTSLSASTTAPSALDPIPAGFVQDVPYNSTFTFSVTDTTDASVQRRIQIYEKMASTWLYQPTATASTTIGRSGSNMTFTYTPSLGYSKYYKAVLTATDDQGASDTETYYFSTQADNSAPSQVSKAFMSFIGESNDRSNVIAQISFSESSDNDAISNYYLWTKSYLEGKNIINSDGSRDLYLDGNSNGSVSDEELNIALRQLVWSGNYVKTITSGEIGDVAYFRVSGSDVDKFDNNGTAGNPDDDIYLVPNSVAEDVFYVSAADTAITITGNLVPNFSEFQIVDKAGDMFGAEREVTLGASNYTYSIGDGSLDVWDAIYLYRHIIGRADEYPLMYPDITRINQFDFPSNLTLSGTR